MNEEAGMNVKLLQGKQGKRKARLLSMLLAARRSASSVFLLRQPCLLLVL